MRISPYILVWLLSIFVTASAIGQGVNIYSNPSWVSDSLIGIATDYQTGAVFRPQIQPLRFNRAFIPSPEGDSNSYSRIRYAISSNENQRFRAGIHRPVGKESGFDLDILRISNPGWLTSSFLRQTVLNLGVYHAFPSGRVSLHLDGRIFVDDKEQNGGLQGESYSIQEDGGLLGEMNGDVYLDDAYTRRQASYVNGRVLYKPTKLLRIAGKAGLESDQMDVRDISPTASYYEPFRDDTSISVVRDSSALLRGHLAGETQLLLDSLAKRMFYVGARQSIMRFVTNESAFNLQNTSLYGGYDADLPKRLVRVNGQFFPIGYNAGDYLLTGLTRQNLASNDSTDESLALTMSGSIQRKRPALLFEQYRSTVRSVDTVLNKINSIDLSTKLLWLSDKAMASVEAFYQLRSNYVYFDEEFRVRQINGALNIVGASIRGNVDKKRYYLGGGVTYQTNLREALYNVPSWNADATAAIRFPVFNKSIYLDAGFTAWFFSTYRARGYIPYLDQFYIQTNQRFDDYFQFDPFVKATIQSVDVILRVVHANYGLLNDDPLIAPGYPSVPRYFQVTIDWKFKN